MANNQKKLKAFVRYDGSGRVVASSLILRKNKPRVGRWYEIPEYLCCNGTSPSTTTTTTTSGGGGSTPTAFIKAYWLNANDSCNTTTYGDLLFYSLATSLAPEIRIYTDAALTIPVQTGLVIYDAATMTRYVVGGAGLIYLYNCPEPTTTTTTTTAPVFTVSGLRWGNSSGDACGAVNPAITVYTTGPLQFGAYVSDGNTIYFDQALTQPVTYPFIASTGLGQLFDCSNGVLSNQRSC